MLPCTVRTRSYSQTNATPDLVVKSLIHVRGLIDRTPIDCQQVISSFNIPGDRCRTQRNDFGHAQTSGSLIFTTVETQTNATSRRWISTLGSSRTEVRRIELTNHQLHQATHLVWRARTLDEWLILRAYRFPVGAVIGRVVEEIAQVGPTLPKHFHLFVREVDVHFRRD